MRRPSSPVLAALCAALLAGCGVESASICHPVNNPCATLPDGGADLVCQGGACKVRCNLDPSVCPEKSGCDKGSGLCAGFCSFGFCQPPAVCSSGLCIKP